MKKHRLVFRAVDLNGWENIRNGRKPVETRAATVRYRDIQAGDVLVVVCGTDSFEKTIEKAEHYDSVESLLASLPLASVFPDLSTKEEAYKEYQSYPGYKEKIAKHGIMAFHLS